MQQATVWSLLRRCRQSTPQHCVPVQDMSKGVQMPGEREMCRNGSRPLRGDLVEAEYGFRLALFREGLPG